MWLSYKMIICPPIGAMCFAELGAVIPRAGGPYQYILHAYGNLAGFMVSWSTVVVLIPSSTALLAITLGTYVSDYVIPGNCAPPREAIQLFAILIVSTLILTLLKYFERCMYLFR